MPVSSVSFLFFSIVEHKYAARRAISHGSIRMPTFPDPTTGVCIRCGGDSQPPGELNSPDSVGKAARFFMGWRFLKGDLADLIPSSPPPPLVLATVSGVVCLYGV